MNAKVANANRRTGVNELKRISVRMDKVVKVARELGAMPQEEKELQMIFTVAETCKLVNRNRSTITRYAREKLIPAPQEYIIERPARMTNGELIKQEPVRRFGYKFADIHAMRQHFKSFPYRNEATDEAIIVGIQNFKGGSGKSTVAVAAAHYFTRLGYRVLLVDCDPQGTATCAHGLLPEVDLPGSLTMAHILDGSREPEYIDEIIRPTYWPQLDFIGANLFLSNGEMQMYASMIQMGSDEERNMVFRRFRDSLEHAKQRYDIVILDTQPGLGGLGISAFCAADAVVVPCPPRMYDFASTAAFFRMWAENLEVVWPDKQYKWVRVLATQVQQSIQSQAELIDMMRSALGQDMVSKVFLFKQDIQRAANLLRSPFEDPDTSKDIINMMESLFQSIEIEVKRGWPSRSKELEAMAEV